MAEEKPGEGETLEVTPKEPTSTVKPEIPEVPETVEELKERLAKANLTAENYKSENEKYRRQGRKDPTAIIEEPRKGEATLDESDQRFIQNSAVKSLKDVYEDQFRDKMDGLTEVQYQKFNSVLRALKTDLISNALEKGVVVSNRESAEVLETALSVALGPKGDTKAIAEARMQGQADILEAQKGDMGLTTTIPKTSKGVLPQDKEVEEQSGGLVSAERAKEIRENRAKRQQEYAPKYGI